MNYCVSIRSYSSNKPVLIINDKLAEKLGIEHSDDLYVSFGLEKKYLEVQMSQKLYEMEMLLPESVIESLHLPVFADFEIRIEKNEIILGPCIGILAGHKDEDITKRYLKEISLNLLDYQNIHGAVIVFALDRVNRKRELIEGYCFNPKTDSWEKGVYPYPLAIYKKANISDKWQKYFLSVIGDKVFNNYSFDKWQMYEWFSKERDISSHLPYTKIYESKQDIVNMLEKYGTIYVKPIWGMKGFGVVRVSKENKEIVFRYRKDEENIIVTAKDENKLDELTKKLFVPGEHIVQQGLSLLKYNDGVVDFRCVMQKNDTRKWVCNAIVARTGAKGSVVSNISSGGFAFPAVELIKEALSIPESETFEIKQRMISLCMKVCRALDRYGNFGTLGLDLGIDNDNNIWLIEVNNRQPHPAIALRVNDILAYYNILAGPLYYAKSLAGFGYKGGE